MYYLVSVDRNSMAVHFTRSDCVGFEEVQCIQCSGWGRWWYVVECSEEDENVRSQCEEDEGTDYEDGDSDTDW